MPKNFNHLGSRWIKAPISMLLEFSDHFHYPICLVLNNDKKVIIDYDSESVRPRLESFGDKNVTHVYLREADLVSFMREIKESLNLKKNNNDLEAEAVVLTLSGCFELVRNSFHSLGLSSTNIDLAVEVNMLSIKMLSESPNLVSLLKKMEKDLNPYFIRAILSSSMSTCLVDAYSWGSQSIKEKVSLACMIRQLNWNQEHFKIYDEGSSIKKIEKLPLEMANLLKANGTFSKEVIEIVEQSFETPDAKGFPRGLGAASIVSLSALSIVSHSLIQKLSFYKYDYNKKDEILSELKEQFKEGQFIQIMEGVCRMIAA